jgi:hypothetical protein
MSFEDPFHPQQTRQHREAGRDSSAPPPTAMSTKLKDVMRALRPEKLGQYFNNFIYRQQQDLRTHPQGAQRFVFKLMFGAQFFYYFGMYFGWNRKKLFFSPSSSLFLILFLSIEYLISERREVIKNALEAAHIH